MAAAISAHRGRHPRSRGERLLLADLDGRVARALHIAQSGVGSDVLAEAACDPLPKHNDAVKPALSSNRGARLYYTAPSIPGKVLNNRRHPYNASSSDEYIDFRNDGINQLTGYTRSMLLGEMSDFLPSHRAASAARAHFDELLVRVQQHQLSRTVQNEVSARRPDANWNWHENRFHIVPVTGTHRIIETGAWAEFIRAGGDPLSNGMGFELVPDVRAERC